MTDSIPQNLRNLDTSKVKNCKELTQKERNILLKFNLLAYDLFCKHRHLFWLKNVKTVKRPSYYKEEGEIRDYRNTKGMPSMEHMKDDPEWTQLCLMEDYLTNEYYCLKYGGDINQGNYCLNCECVDCRTVEQKGLKVKQYVVNSTRCSKWVSLRWCPMIKDSFGDNDEKVYLTNIYRVLKLKH